MAENTVGLPLQERRPWSKPASSRKMVVGTHTGASNPVGGQRCHFTLIDQKAEAQQVYEIFERVLQWAWLKLQDSVPQTCSSLPALLMIVMLSERRLEEPVQVSLLPFIHSLNLYDNTSPSQILKGRIRAREVSHPLFDSPSGHNWAGLIPGTSGFNQVSNMVSETKIHGPSFSVFPDTLAGETDSNWHPYGMPMLQTQNHTPLSFKMLVLEIGVCHSG